jgi:hypothetical protein
MKKQRNGSAKVITFIYEEAKKRFSKSDYLFMIIYQVYISILDETLGVFKKFSVKGTTSSMIENEETFSAICLSTRVS